MLASKIAQYCAEIIGTPLCPTEGAVNIVYIEGANDDGTANPDRPDRWNDMRYIVGMVAGEWQVIFRQVATTEPGVYYTQRPLNKKGAARIELDTYHQPAWAEGLHQGKQPALVQRKSVLIRRDFNRDGKRNNSEKPHQSGLIGLNQHSTSPDFKGQLVGKWSAACLVGYDYAKHLNFLQILRFDVRRLASEAIKQEYLHDTWMIAGDRFAKFTPKQAA